ncbi:MAG: AAA domain-containing protein, partial [bacterium]|nr:AAA domain-containing protein [bacterium]
MTNEHELAAGDVEAIGELQETLKQVRGELGRAVIGQNQVIDELLMCLIARGHALLMGVPGLAKTLLVSKLSECLSLDFSRIQFTPDLMPMDITGTDILEEDGNGKRYFKFVEGPIFANIVLADEINRAPAKTQAAMLEAMQEHRVTVLGKT